MKKDINFVWKEFEDNSISHSATHYLFTITELHAKNGYARMIDVSKKLKITPWSCSTWVKALMKKWLIQEDENKFLWLTKKWQQIISQIMENREILFHFFSKSLWIQEDKALINACKIEHLIGIEVIQKLKKYKD